MGQATGDHRNCRFQQLLPLYHQLLPLFFQDEIFYPVYCQYDLGRLYAGRRAPLPGAHDT